MSHYSDLLSLSISSLLLNKQELIEVNSFETILNVLNIFNKFYISSLPVYEDIPPSPSSPPSSSSPSAPSLSSSSSSNKRVYLGIISIIDILVYINRNYKHSNDTSEDILNQPIRKALGSTVESSNLFIINENTNLSFVIDKMCQGFHRCIVVNSNYDHNSNDSINSPKLLTQTDVVKYFLDRLDSFPHIENALKRPVEEILSKNELLTTCETELISTALNKLCIHSALPVLDKGASSFLSFGHGQIVANLSATDFVSLNSESDFQRVANLTVKEFLTGSSSKNDNNDNESNGSDDGDDGDYAQPAVCITTKGTILTAALFMIENHMHRVWIVAPSDYSGMDGYGVGCVSLTDILTTIALFTSPPSEHNNNQNNNHHHNYNHHHDNIHHDGHVFSHLKFHLPNLQHDHHHNTNQSTNNK